MALICPGSRRLLPWWIVHTPIANSFCSHKVKARDLQATVELGMTTQWLQLLGPQNGSGKTLTNRLATAEPDTNSALLVQTAHEVTYANGRLQLHGVSPASLYLSGRSQRVVGHIGTADLVAAWNRETSALNRNPPTAVLSFLDSQSGTDADVVVQLAHPELTDGCLRYDVVLLEGLLTARHGGCTIFIDVQDRPISPVSFTAGLSLTRGRERWMARQIDRLPSLASP